MFREEAVMEAPTCGHLPKDYLRRSTKASCEYMEKKRTTPEYITSLQPNEIFVFGSNLRGMHGGGAAYVALRKFGAIMGQGVGPWPPENKKSRPQINMLVDGKKTGKNFVNEFTFNYAKYRVENKQHNETIDEYRLFNNMLSSQPMAFNLLK